MTREQITNEYTRSTHYVMDRLRHCATNEIDTLCFILKILRSRQAVVVGDTVSIEPSTGRARQRWTPKELAIVDEALCDDTEVIVTPELIEQVQQATGRSSKAVSAALYKARAELKNKHALEKDDV